MIKENYLKARNKMLKRSMGGYPVWDVYEGHFKVTYRGIPTLKCPFDYVMYQMILSELKPDLVIEIGTNVGGTSLYIANLMDAIGHGMLHTIDIESCAHELAREHRRIKLFTNGWRGYDLSATKGFSKILVIDDASHMYEDTLGALNKFSEIVSAGSYFIVEDGIVTRLKRDKSLDGGPLRAIREFLKTNKRFIIDRSRCDMFGKDATFNTDGYLKRIG